LISTPIYCRDNKQGIREWLRSYKGVEEASWFARDDLAPFFMVWWRSFQWAFEKLFTKVTKARARLLLVRRKRRVQNDIGLVDTQAPQSVDSPTAVL
jgi:hypothetical protein